jgi:hypothetical protein
MKISYVWSIDGKWHEADRLLAENNDGMFVIEIRQIPSIAMERRSVVIGSEIVM